MAGGSRVEFSEASVLEVRLICFGKQSVVAREMSSSSSTGSGPYSTRGAYDQF